MRKLEQYHIDYYEQKLDGITISKWEDQSIKGFGNDIVQQEALDRFSLQKVQQPVRLKAGISHKTGTI